MSNLIKIAVSLAFISCTPANLSLILKKIHLAQIELLKESRASKWPQAILLSK